MKARFADLEKYQLFAGTLRIDLVQQKVWCGDVEVDALPQQKRVLTLFVLNRNDVVSKQDVYECITDRNLSLVFEQNTVAVCISRLRQLLLKAQCELKVKTVRGQGYILQ